MSPAVHELFEHYVAASYDKQVFLADMVGNNTWRFEMASGTLSFGPKLKWNVQLLGSESTSSNTWLWSWANHASNIPEAMTRAARQMRELGAGRSLPELTTPQLPVAEIDGVTLSMIASGYCDARAFYRGPYQGGTAFFLIDDPAYPRFIVDPAVRIAILFPQVIATYEVNHRNAFAGYLAYYGLEAHAEGPAIVAGDSARPQLVAEFNANDRMTRLESVMRQQVDSE